VDVPRGTLFPGTDRSYHGPEGVRRFWDEFLEPWETIRIEVEEMRERAGRVVAFVRFHATGSGSGVELNVPFVHLITIRDGLATRFDAYTDRAEALEAAGLRE
jgi:ketosteroid isomerase-like protein